MNKVRVNKILGIFEEIKRVRDVLDVREYDLIEMIKKLPKKEIKFIEETIDIDLSHGFRNISSNDDTHLIPLTEAEKNALR